MIKELSELGKSLRAGKDDSAWVHDALKDEMISMELVISPDGTFQQLQFIEDKLTPAEALTAKKGKARLLLDKPEEVLCYGGDISKKKHQLFLDKIALFNNLNELAPVVAFYDNKALGLDKALEQFETMTESEDKKVKKKLVGNIGFRIYSESTRIHEKPEVLNAVIEKYEATQREQLTGTAKKCSVCGTSDYPVEDIPHGMVKQVPGGRSGGCALISFNGDNNPFESYGMVGNENSGICTNCARAYMEGFDNLLTKGVLIKNKKNKDDFLYEHRWPRKRSVSYGMDTTMVFWTRTNQTLDEVDLLDEPSAGEVARMIESLASGREHDSRYLEPEKFYSCTLSGAAARIAVRDWIETSLGEFRTSITKWFSDIAITNYDFDQKKLVTNYAPLYALAKCCQRRLMGGKKYDDDDISWARVASNLWKAAIYNHYQQSSPVPVWILSKILQRARVDKYGVTPERAALIKLILNRNFKGGGFMITKDGIQGEKPVAYICGEIFAKMESIQYAAAGGDRNAGIREKYFTYAMTTPLAAFGRLFNLSSKHFTKLKHEKPGLAVNLDKELQELCKGIEIDRFPAIFKLEEQGQFAIGYYHQKQKQFAETTKK